MLAGVLIVGVAVFVALRFTAIERSTDATTERASSARSGESVMSESESLAMLPDEEAVAREAAQAEVQHVEAPAADGAKPDGATRNVVGRVVDPDGNLLTRCRMVVALRTSHLERFEFAGDDAGRDARFPDRHVLDPGR